MHGQCGTGKKSLQSSPFIIPEIKAKQIVNGSCFSLVLSTSNEVFLFGSGGDGRTKNSKDLLTPTLLKEFSDKNIKQIAAGTDHILTLTSDGIIWGFGFGQVFLRFSFYFEKSNFFKQKKNQNSMELLEFLN